MSSAGVIDIYAPSGSGRVPAAGPGEGDFTATRPNELWVVDFTYVPTWSGTVFSAFVNDVFSRRIVRWRTKATMPTELPLDALDMALWTRQQANELVDGLRASKRCRQPIHVDSLQPPSR